MVHERIVTSRPLLFTCFYAHGLVLPSWAKDEIVYITQIYWQGFQVFATKCFPSGLWLQIYDSFKDKYDIIVSFSLLEWKWHSFVFLHP